MREPTDFIDPPREDVRYDAYADLPDGKELLDQTDDRDKAIAACQSALDAEATQAWVQAIYTCPRSRWDGEEGPRESREPEVVWCEERDHDDDLSL